MFFINNKKTKINYIIKENSMLIEIDMKTTKIIINNNIIKVNYIITDSNNEYEFYLEMSD